MPTKTVPTAPRPTRTTTTPAADRGGRRPPRRPWLILLLLTSLCAVPPGLVRAAGEPADAVMLGPDGRIHVPGDALVDALLVDASEQVRRGAARYHLVCAACHGNSGLGLAEGRRAFPLSHQRCERCHRPANPAHLPDAAITARNAFSLGDAPALRGAGSLQAFPTGAALHAYVRAAMPRYQPGSLSDEESLAVTAFLMVLNGNLPASATLGSADAGRLSVRGGAPPD